MKKTIIALSVAVMATTFVYAGDSAKVLIGKNGCMSCHNIMGMKDAPPFAGISWRNSRGGTNAKATLKQSNEAPRPKGTRYLHSSKFNCPS